MELLANMIERFKASEVCGLDVDSDRVAEVLAKHRDAVQKLEAIEQLMKRRARKIESVEGFGGTFPSLRSRYMNDIDTLNRAINRVWRSYRNL
jgi:uncharacterized glyoxalase superfamily metalloenzyme YdcJ